MNITFKSSHNCDKNTKLYKSDIYISNNIVLNQKEEEAVGRGLKFGYGLSETKLEILDSILAFENSLGMNNKF